MSNTEKRNQRINLVLSPSIKSGLTKIAAIQQISINELANQTFEKLIHEYKDQIQLYDQFIQQISSSSHNSKNLSSTQELNSCIIPPHAHR